MRMTDELFNKIILNLKSGKPISADVDEILDMIRKDENTMQFFLSTFLYKIIESNKYSKEVISIVNDYLSGRIDIKTLSYKLFNEGKTGYSEYDDMYDKSLIVHDNIKRGLRDYIYQYKKAQFYHFRENETLFEKMLRVLFEFTRDDEPYLRGVCFDYCMFLTALNIIKEKESSFIIVDGIESNGEHNWLIINNDGDKTVLDPFNGIYTRLEDYKVIKGIISVMQTDAKNLTGCELGKSVSECRKR